MKILIIEDEENIAKILKRGFEKEGYAADYITDGEAGLRRIQLHHSDYDVVILDLMLPKISGSEICRTIRDEKISLPILVLTAKGAEEDKVSLLEIGADDYLTKPFSFKELLARIRALTRRPQKIPPKLLTIGDLTIDSANKIATKDNVDIKLTLTEFRILEYLMQRPNQIIEKESLVNNVWDFNSNPQSNVVDVFVCRLKKKLDDHENERIENVRGIGYKINF